MITSSFDKNYGEAIVAISQQQNSSTIEITIQEGKYVDERLQITFNTIDKIPLIITDPSVFIGSEITLESVPAFMQQYSDLKAVQKKCKRLSELQYDLECFFRVVIKLSANKDQNIDLRFSEVLTDLSGTTCLPTTSMEVRISGASRTDQYILEFQQKTWHFSLIVTILSVVATYFTVAELKKVHSSLEQLHEAGQTETHGKRLSLITNCLICIWNMCYAISFFVSAMYFKVRCLNDNQTIAYVRVLCCASFLVLYALLRFSEQDAHFHKSHLKPQCIFDIRRIEVGTAPVLRFLL